jgi:O-acetyl-ADP-ribose deacetylase (regulator of RNase III)
MIRGVNGNVFDSRHSIICHQVNCRGVMGAGIAKTVKEEMITADHFSTYKYLCRSLGPKMLGRVLYVPSLQADNIIANIFGQDDCGAGLQTDYQALERGFENVRFLPKDTTWMFQFQVLLAVD